MTTTSLAASDADAGRYARHRSIPGWDQERLRAATAIVVGVGALGNEVAKNLALAGVGRLVLCDPDLVATSNLSRAVLFGPGDAGPRDGEGMAKVEVAAGSLRRLVPGIAVEARQHDLAAGVGLGELTSAAVVLGCLDTRRARLRLLGRCALVEAPLVDGGTVAWGGEVRLRLATSEPCYGCALTPHQRAASDLPWSCGDVSDDEPAAASIASSALVAAWMTIAALRVIFGTPPDYRAVRVDGLSGQVWPVTTTRDPSCPHHKPIGAADDIGLANDSTVASLVDRLPPGAEPLSWTGLVLAGKCAHCRTYSKAVPYIDATSALCRSCGRRTGLPLSQHLSDAAGTVPLFELGVAPQDIVAVRMPKGDFRWVRLSP